MTTELHRRLMHVAFELQQRGDGDLATWIQKHIADEQGAAKKRPSRRGVKVKLTRSRGTAVLPLTMVNEALKEAECE